MQPFRRLAPLCLAIGLGVGAAVFPAQPISDADGATPALRVTVYCYANPERTVIHNNRSVSIRIASVGSIYQPYSNEPFAVAKTLAAGATITYYTGYGASSTNPRTLTRRYIYNDKVGTSEGARVKDSKGNRYTDRCG